MNTNDNNNMAFEDEDGVLLLGQRQEYHHSKLLQKLAKYVLNVHGKGLMIDFIATRDIQEGGEIYLDYGNEWQDATISFILIGCFAKTPLSIIRVPSLFLLFVFFLLLFFTCILLSKHVASTFLCSL